MPTFAYMKAKSIVCLLLGAMLCIPVFAQKRMVVVDWDTLDPIPDVSVTSLLGTTVTDSLGYFDVPEGSKTLLFSHLNYSSRLVNLKEVNDTVLLMSNNLRVDGVVVFGKPKEDVKTKRLNESLRMAKTEAELVAADPSKGTDLIKLTNYLVPKKWRKNSKQERQKRLKKALKEYDEKE